MIEVQKEENDIYTVKLGMKSPTVYLDHWAIVKISANAQWRSRFVTALKKNDGTLLFSTLNIIELGRHISAQPNAKLLFEEIGTNWCLIDTNAPTVIEREANMSPGQMSPCFDEVGLRSYYPYIHDEELSLCKIVELVTDQKHTYDDIYAKFDGYVRRMTSLQQAIKLGDTSINPDAYKHGGYNPQQPTQYVYYSLMRSTLWGNMTLNRNDVCDLQHATAALANADFILLDGHWHQQAMNLLKEIPNIKNRVFRDSPDEMERFLCSLENVQFEV